jgi:purine-nucleoside phosphorylase
MRVLGVSIVTDEALPDCLEPADIREIVAIARKGSAVLTRLVLAFLKRL